MIFYQLLSYCSILLLSYYYAIQLPYYLIILLLYYLTIILSDCITNLTILLRFYLTIFTILLSYFLIILLFNNHLTILLFHCRIKSCYLIISISNYINFLLFDYIFCSKDARLPEQLQRAMAAEAEAAREARAKVGNNNEYHHSQ